MPFLTLLLLALTAQAEPFEIYTYVYKGKTVHVKITESEGVRVNDVCVKLGKKCQALEEFRAPPKNAKPLKAAASDAPTAYCRERQGTPLFLKKENTSAFCAFRDLSVIDAVALYKAAHP